MTDRYETEYDAWTQRVRDTATVLVIDYSRAGQLMVGGTWLTGPFQFVNGSWISSSGIVVNDEQVQARTLGGDANHRWNTVLDEAPKPDCTNSGEHATVTDYDTPRDPESGEYIEVDATIGEPAWCWECEQTVPITADSNGRPVFPLHDTKGRVFATT